MADTDDSRTDGTDAVELESNAAVDPGVVDGARAITQDPDGNATTESEPSRGHDGPTDAVEAESAQDTDDATAGGTEAPDNAEDAPAPTFLTRKEYEKVGDDPGLLPRGFEVIDGTGAMPRLNEEMTQAARAAARPPLATVGESGSTGDPTATASHAEDEAEIQHAQAPATPTAPAAPAQSAKPNKKDGPSPVEALGSFLTTGAEAVREVSAAKRAHDTARGELEDLDREIGDREAELEHRQDIESRYDQIITDETARQDAALETGSAAKTQRDLLAAKISELKARLSQEKEDDAQTEKRLRAAVDAIEAKEASSRESGSRLQRRLDDAKRGAEKAEEEKKSAMDAAQKSIDSANSRLGTLREEFAGIQRNPSANSAEYSVRTSQLQNEISDAMEELRQAQGNLPRITAEVQRNLDAANAAVQEAQKPIDAAKKAFREVTAEADAARDELDTAKRDAAARQRELRDQISDQEKALKEEERKAQAAQEDADDAQASMDEANEIHAHPEITRQLANRLDEDRRIRADKVAQVERLAAAEQEVRDRTRGSRLRFLGAIAVTIAVIILIVTLWFSLR